MIRYKNIFLGGCLIFMIGVLVGEYNLLAVRKKVYHHLNKNKKLTLFPNFDKIYLAISDEDFINIKKIRDEALTIGVLDKKKAKYFPVKVNHNNQVSFGKIRLKGRLRDHFSHSKKWSFKIKIIEGDTIMGMKKFNLQHPKTRNYLNELVFHSFAKYENIISLKYYFVNLYLNNENLGIYALEEGFDDELIKNNNKTNSIIIKFSDDFFWGGEKNPLAGFWNFSNEKYIHSEVKMYNQKKIYKDSTLLKYFLEAKSKIHDFRNFKLKTSQVFDINKLSKYLAIVNILSGEHAFGWINMRFYYNPLNNLLEPISYDSNSGFNNVFIPFEPPLCSQFQETIFADTAFLNLYMKTVNRMSKKNYIENFFKSINKKEKKYISALYKEFIDLDFSENIFLKKAQIIQKKFNEPIRKENIIINLNHADDSSLIIHVLNNQKLPIEILSVSNNEEKISKPLQPTVIYARPFSSFPVGKEIEFKWLKSYDLKNLKINYKIVGSEIENEAKVNLFRY